SQCVAEDAGRITGDEREAPMAGDVHIEPTTPHGIQQPTEWFSVAFTDNSRLEVRTFGSDDSIADDCLKLLEHYLREHKNRLMRTADDGMLGENGSDADVVETLLPFAACVDCGELSIGELMTRRGVNLPVCLTCAVRRMK
ncbi:MAG: hypothetical protein M3220_13675, partial [Chloroflexota bacterium]|nr:hypothetical protein [Chloroflexota bacterium]